MLTSVFDGKDEGPLLDALIAMHAQPGFMVIDCTYNKGRVWKGSKTRVFGGDLNPVPGIKFQADFRALPFADKSVGVLVFDPPHVPNRSSESSKKDFNERFGINLHSSAKQNYSLRHLNAAFLEEAKRILAPDGIILAKLCDYVHNHRYVWAVAEFVQDATSVGLTPCDLVVKTRKAPIMDPRWQRQHHTRRSHSYWIVVRNGRCEV